jgi:hypothetical protein
MRNIFSAGPLRYRTLARKAAGHFVNNQAGKI